MTPPSDDRAVRRWLIAGAASVAIALAVGGITRLTESGLAITEWRPVSGILPPLSSAEWDQAYQSYLRIPEAQTVHRGITLPEFRTLFWWEWVHRVLARLVGLVLALPFFVLLARGRIRSGYRARLFLLPILAAAQGALGWYMVKSGLAERTDVSAYRLTAHLGLALAIYVICVWTAQDLGRPA
ncbi:MAG TPA: COX15/CtaA family protein, partial [Gemmatimonadales bacterium]|nr:COX15/CtaA family protein [Gemmatimonadales bacterium]